MSAVILAARQLYEGFRDIRPHKCPAHLPGSAQALLLMAAIDWPYDLATIEWSGYERGGILTWSGRRSRMGLMRQAILVSRSYELRRFTVAVKLSDQPAF